MPCNSEEKGCTPRIDLRKACDIVPRYELWEAMLILYIPKKFKKWLKTCIEGIKQSENTVEGISSSSATC